MTSLALLVQNARQAANLTQNELDLLIGKTRGYVWRIEGGHIMRPSPDVLVQLERHLGISREEMNRAMGHLSPDEPGVMSQLRRLAAIPNEQERAAALVELPPEWQQIIRSLAAAYLRQAADRLAE